MHRLAFFSRESEQLTAGSEPLLADAEAIGLCLNDDHPAPVNEVKAMFSWGYIDDSTKGDSLVLSCVIIESSAGFWLEVEWKSVIEETNAELSNSGRPRISRFHGADCNACAGEFRDWDMEKDQIAFIRSLQALMQKYRINSVGYSVKIADVAEVFPEATSGAREMAHVILLCYLLTTCAEEMPGIGGVVGLIHDRGSYDSVFEQVDNAFRKKDPALYDKRVMSLQRSTWEESVLLQVADFMAYENSKVIVSIENGREWRRSIKGVVDGDNFGGRLAGIPRETLVEFRQYLDSGPSGFRDALYRAGRAAP
jgi:hypothetical protein